MSSSACFYRLVKEWLSGPFHYQWEHVLVLVM